MADQIGFNCSKWPEGETCSVQMTGDEEHVLEAAAQHRAAAHQDDRDTAKGQISNAVDNAAHAYAWRIIQP